MDTVTITKQEYFSLLKQNLRVERLDNGGVDNWEWYGESLNPEGEPDWDDAVEEIRLGVFGEIK